MRAEKRVALCGVLLAAVAAGCGNSGIQGVLDWSGSPIVAAHAAHGTIRNTTSHSQQLDAHAMRLLDDRGQKVTGRIRVGEASLPAHSSTSLEATWKSGKPVRIDYGAGTLALPSK